MLLYVVEPSDELLIGFLQSIVGIKVVKSCCIDYAKQEIAQLLGRFFLVFSFQFSFQLTQFFSHFRPNVVLFFPIETYVSCLILYAIGFDDTRQGIWHTRKHRLVTILFLQLYLLPVFQHLIFVIGLHVTINVRMPENQLVGLAIANVGNIELTLFTSQQGVKCRVHQYVAQFFTNIFHVVFSQSVTQFVCFFYRIRAQALKGLLLVPRAFLSQIVEHIEQSPKGFHLFFFRMHTICLVLTNAVHPQRLHGECRSADAKIIKNKL